MRGIRWVLLSGWMLASVWTALGLASAEDRTYQVGVLDFPPYAVIEKSGVCKGILVDLLEKVLQRGGMSYTLTGFPQKRLFSNLATGQTDIYMGIKGVPYYDGKVIYSRFPVSDLDLRIYFRKGTPSAEGIGALKGKRVIVIMGYGYGGLIQFLKDPANQITLDPSHTHAIAFRKLAAGRADYVLDYRQPASIAVKEEGIKGLESNSISKIDIFFIAVSYTHLRAHET